MEDGKFPRSAMIAITVLRVLVGWPFLYEGIAKLSSPTWSATGYLRARHRSWPKDHRQVLVSRCAILPVGDGSRLAEESRKDHKEERSQSSQAPHTDSWTDSSCHRVNLA